MCMLCVCAIFSHSFKIVHMQYLSRMFIKLCNHHNELAVLRLVLEYQNNVMCYMVLHVHVHGDAHAEVLHQRRIYMFCT